MYEYIPAILFIALLLLAGMAAWIIDEFHRWRRRERLKAKQAASRPVNAWWSYNCKGEIKQQGHELRRMSWEEVKKGGEKEDAKNKM